MGEMTQTLIQVAQTKVCPRCKRDLPLEQYQRATKAKDGRQWACRDCSAIRQRAWHKEKVDERRWYFREKRYGVDKERFYTMLAAQSGGCAICGASIDEKTATVDHCHTTGKARGLLCKRCNSAIAVFDNMPDFLDRIKEYLNQHKDDAVKLA